VISPPILALVSAAAAVGVFLDARTRFRPLAAAAWALGALFAVGLAVPVYLIVRPTRAESWGISEILGLALLFAFAAFPLAARLVNREASETIVPLPTVAALAVAQNALFAGAALYIVRVKYRLPLSRVGLVVGRWPQRIRQGLVAGAAGLVGNGVGQHLTVAILGLAMGRQEAAHFVAREEARSPVYRLLPSLHHLQEVALLALIVAVVVPVGEELFFRGLVFGALRRTLARWMALVASAGLFAAAHLQPVEFLPIFILGVILAYVYDLTGSLVPGMIAHGLNNLVALLTFTLSGAGR
jgi:membrane protease YdiL (CAAX protease family)